MTNKQKSSNASKRKVAAEFKAAMQTNRAKKSRPRQMPPVVARKGAGKQVVVIQNKDSTKTTMPVKEFKKLKRMAAKEIPEKIVTLLKANTIYCTSADFPVGVNGPQDLNWEEVAESVIFARLASDPQYAIPIGPAALKMYLWWFMMDRLRKVGGLTPEPTFAQLPTFPENGAIPVGWAKFVEYLMPFQDPKTGTNYQFKYAFGAGFPTNTSAVLNPNGASTDTTFGALGNFALIPNPIAPVGNQEDTWIFTNTAFLFATVTGASFDDLSRYISSIGQYVEAVFVPTWAPDASACAIPYGHGSPNPGVYCQSEFFDEEMACILHPPINALVLNVPIGSAYNMLYPFDWCCKPLPQVFIQSPIKSVAGNPNLASQGQLELILNYGYITQNCCFTTGARKSFLANGQRLWPNLRSYCPYYYVMNLSGWHQFCTALIGAIALQAPTNVAVNAVGNNVYFNTSDITTTWAALESIMLARCTEFAYAGLVLWSSDDVVSQTNYGSDFRTANLNPVMADMLDTIAPTVKNGRLSIPVYDYRNYPTYGLTYQAAITNPNVARWLQIGTQYGVIGANLNLFVPLNVTSTGFANGPWVVPYTASLLADTWQVRGPGTVGANQFQVSEAVQGQTSPLPATYVVTNTLGPLAPCRLAANFIIRLDELFSSGTGTWLDLSWAKLGGYQNQTQLSSKIVTTNLIIGTNNLVAQSVSINFMPEPLRIGAYFPLDQESIGRSFAYATRIAFVGPSASPINNDRFPAIQSLSGNSPPQDSLVMNTQQGGNSNFNQTLNARMAQGLHQMEALRASLGEYHQSLIANFAGEEMTVAQAVEVIIRCKTSSTTAPYHTETSASLVSYNSPSIFDTFINTIFDVGNNIVGGVGKLIGGVSGIGNGLLSSPLIQNVGSQLVSDFLLRRKAIDIPNHISKIVAAAPPASVSLHPIMFRKKNATAVKIAASKLAKLNVIHEILPDPTSAIDYDKMAEKVKDLLTISQFKQLTN